MIFKTKGIEFLQPQNLAAGIGGHPQEFQVAHPWNLHWILKSKEKTGPGPFLRGETGQILALEQNAAGGHGVIRMAGDNLGKGALATAIATHQGMDLTCMHREVYTAENLLICHGYPQVGDLKQGRGSRHGILKWVRGIGLKKWIGQPTDPSSFNASNLSASAANSSGN